MVNIIFDRRFIGRDVACYALIATTAILVYSNTFAADFVYDDSQAIVANPVVTGQVSAGHAWTLDFWGNRLGRGSHKSYRPLTTLTFRLNAAVFGMKPSSFHVTNVLLHAMASCLLFAFGQRFRLLALNTEAGLFSSLLFAVHPIHCEAVAGVVGRADVLVTIAVLVGLLLFDRNKSPIIATLCATVAICFKETGIMLLPILAAFHLVKPKKFGGNLRRSVATLTFGFLILSTIRHAVNGFEAPRFSKSDNPIAHHPQIIVRTLTFLYLPLFHLQLLVYSKELSFDWSMDAIPPVTSLLDWRFILSAMFYSGLILLGSRLLRQSGFYENLFSLLEKNGAKERTSDCCQSKRSPTIRGSRQKHSEIAQNTLIGFVLLILPFIPATNLFYYVGFVAAERTLYLPSVGYCILLGLLYSACSFRFGSKVTSYAAFVVVLLHATRTWERNSDWMDEESLYRSAVKINPPKAYSNLGRVYASRMRLDEAETAYKAALLHRPNMADTWYNLGVLYQEKKNLSEAIKSYRTAVSLRKTFAVAYLNLGIVYESMGDDEKATTTWRTCSTIDVELVKSHRDHLNTKTSCRFRLAKLLLRHRRLTDAQRLLEEAVMEAPRVYPFLHSLLCLFAEVCETLGQHEKAELLFHEALRYAPDHVPALLTMAHLSNKLNRTSESNVWFSRALNVAPKSADVYHHVGLAAMLRGDVAAAETAYRNALELVSTHADSLKALATLLREQQKYGESEQVLLTLKTHHPTAENLGDYGAILHMNGKLEEARRFYMMSLRLNPGNSVVNENLRRLERKLSNSSQYS
ncbi:hypothetical protein Q1695_013509 [Nippostrongylus brasiliensis]|nr:hypothetical protein Q1695_013509 [Nippostrongylus brasiliensis]